MSTKALFETALGGAQVPLGPCIPFVRTSGNVCTATAHGLQTGAGPFKVNTTNGDPPSGITATVRASLAYTPATDIEDETVTIDGKVYTWKNSPSADGEVDVDATNATAAENLAAAINLGAGAGTAYGVSMAENPDVTAEASGDTCLVTAKTTDAAVGNAIAVAEAAAGAWAGGGVNLTGGVDGVEYYIIVLTDDTFSLATSKANAIAGTAVALADAGTGVHDLVRTVSTLSSHLQDAVDRLTSTGVVGIPAADRVKTFWSGAIDGIADHLS